MNKTKRHLALWLFWVGFAACLSAQSIFEAFSVSDNKWVTFSKGNLQLVGSTWQFASSQLEWFGTAQYNGHLDMFPYASYSAPDDGLDWYTLSLYEWNHLFTTPPVLNTLSDGARYTMTTIADSVNGLIIFPDFYIHPAGTDFEAGVYNGSSNFSSTVSLEGWEKMEKAGCVFLPAAGYCSMGKTWNRVGTAVCYSSSTPTDGYYYDPYFIPSGVYLTETSNKLTWSSVRLVRDVEINVDAISEPFESSKSSDSEWYDLNGCRVSHPSKGIYVNGGKKRLVR